MAGSEDRTVYSTAIGDLRKLKQQSSNPGTSIPPNQQTIYLHRESKGRGGKVVTLVKNFQLKSDELKLIAKELKQVCGTGGTIKEKVIEIQGDHRGRIADYLKQRGFKVKVAGG